MTRPVRLVIGRRLLLAGIAAISLTAAGLAGHQAPATPAAQFRSGVDVLQLDVSVLDKKRAPVAGLTAADFAVRIDGRPAPIVAFTPVTIPVPTPPAAPWMQEVSSDVVSNTVSDEGRLIVLLFDQSIAPEQTPTARRVARATVEAMGAADVASAIYVGRATPQNFTSDRRILLSTIDQAFMGFGEVEDVNEA